MTDIAVYGVLLVLIFLVFVTRTAFRTLYPQVVNADGFVNMIISREIRRLGHRLPETISQSMVPGRFSYPCFLHFVLSFLPEHYYPTIDRFFSEIMDLLFTLLVLSLHPLGILSLHETAVALALFVATPQYARPDLAHGVGLSPRKPSSFLVSLAILALIASIHTGELLYLLASIIISTMILLDSRFGFQALLGITLAFGLLISPQALLIVPVAGLLAVLVSNGFYLTVFFDHVRYSYRFATSKQYDLLYDGWKSIDTVTRLANSRSISDVLLTVRDSVILRGLLDNPVVVPLLFGLVLSERSGLLELPVAGFKMWAFTGVALFIITSLYHLRFLGQPARYLEYTFLPSAIIVAKSFFVFGVWYKAIVVASIGGGLFMFAGYVWGYGQVVYPERYECFNELLDVLESFPSSKLITMPRNIGRRIAWETQHKVTSYLGDGPGSQTDLEEREKMFPGGHGFVTDDTEWLADRFDPDWVVITKKSIPEDECLKPPDTDPWFENEWFSLYQFSDFR